MWKERESENNNNNNNNKKHTATNLKGKLGSLLITWSVMVAENSMVCLLLGHRRITSFSCSSKCSSKILRWRQMYRQNLWQVCVFKATYNLALYSALTFALRYLEYERSLNKMLRAVKRF